MDKGNLATEAVACPTPAVIRVVAAVVSRGNEVLICRRPHDKRHGGLWEFPGGKCEPGESDLDAVRRELWEELAVEVESVGTAEFIILDEGSRFEIVFMPVEIRGEPVCHEHIGISWQPFEQLAAWPLAPSDHRYAQKKLFQKVYDPSSSI